MPEREKGSDDLLREVADEEQVVRGAELEEARNLEEERRLASVRDDKTFDAYPEPHEPGRQHRDDDEAPPEEGRPEFDPLPPE